MNTIFPIKVHLKAGTCTRVRLRSFLLSNQYKSDHRTEHAKIINKLCANLS